MLLSQVRDYIASLEIEEDDHCYSGKLPYKEEKSIGVYNLKRSRNARIIIGGRKNASFAIKSISLLIHWNKNQIQTEEAALRLQECLMECRECQTGQNLIKFIHLYYDEPIPIDTDENGVYEYVIECDVYYEKGKIKDYDENESTVFCR